ncbi:GNAT family N-acetyltransferase [Kitasatospora mediocidica]|uniref:GNAT family N-acetyltransferase n=1 Tax=Kitasatospora mediocidica TaxID=58352 RepID=UPI00068A1042|nr:GNAT family N-acetyltransferase [Kitasatospora mediocidica]
MGAVSHDCAGARRDEGGAGGPELPPEFAAPTGAVAPEVWDRLAGPHFYSSAGSLAMAARDRQGITGAVHAGPADAPDAAVAVTALRDERGGANGWADILTARGLPAPAQRALMVGPRRGYQSHLLPGAAATREQAAALLLPRLRATAADPGLRAALGGDATGTAGTALPCVAMHTSAADLAALRSAGVDTPPVLVHLDAWLPVRPGGWEGYLAGQPSRRRSLIRKERRRFAESGLRVERLPLTACADEAALLLAQTGRRYGGTVDPVALAAEFRLQETLLGVPGEVLLCRDQDGRAIGFSLLYHWGDTFYLRAAGFDYDRLPGVTEYFNLVYYLPLEIAAERGARWLHAGIKASQAKAMRGAELRGLWLLDLSPDSPLHGREQQVHRANQAFLAAQAGESEAVARALSADLRAEFADTLTDLTAQGPTPPTPPTTPDRKHADV